MINTQLFPKNLASATALFKKLYHNRGEIIYVKIPNAIVSAFTVILGLKVFFDLKSDSVAILNFSFAILGGLAGLCFTWSGTFAPQERVNTFIKKLGEKFLYASILIIVASCIHYELRNIDRIRVEYDPFHLSGEFYKWLTLFFKVIASLIFYRAANVALDKLCTLHYFLYRRNKEDE
jgi:hypothetical protein